MAEGKQDPRKTARDWNRRHAIGAPVRYHRIIGEGGGMATKTRSEAWVLSGHSAVVMVDGVSGYVVLEAVKPLSIGANP